MDIIKPEADSEGVSCSTPSCNETRPLGIKTEDPLLIRFPVMKTKKEVSFISVCPLLDTVSAVVVLMSVYESLIFESYICCNVACCIQEVAWRFCSLRELV
jgi:hypothetical protein